jgi:DNA-binding response OmpR family regulator
MHGGFRDRTMKWLGEAELSQTMFEPHEIPSASHRRVLIVEDSPTMLRTLERALSAEGYVLHAVTTAEDAFRELRQHVFHAVVADYELGGKKGDQVLQAAGGLRNPPFRVLISGHHPPTRELKANNAFDAFLVKPFALGAMIELLAHRQSR